eukprot:jgi/Botrbrau1/9650/Bobra.0131s0026.2
MGGTVREDGNHVIDIEDLQKAAIPSFRLSPIATGHPPPVDWFALQAGAGQPHSWVAPQSVSHAGCVTLPRRVSSNTATASLVCSTCNAPLRIRSSLSDDGPCSDRHTQSGAQPVPSPRASFPHKTSGSSGAKCKSTCFRLSSALYVLIGGSFLVMALLAVGHFERMFRPTAAFENIWLPGYQTVNYHVEIEELWEIDDEAQRFQDSSSHIALGNPEDIRSPTSRGEILALIMGKYGIMSVVDCGCGPLTWQPDFFAIMAHARIPFRYLGVDSSKDITLTSKWEAKYNSVAQKNMCEFQTMDLRKERLPDGFDLLMMVDMLENLPFADVLDILYNIQYSSAAVRRGPHSPPYSMRTSLPLRSPRLSHGLLLALLIAFPSHYSLPYSLPALHLAHCLNQCLPCLLPCLLGRKHWQGGRRSPQGMLR